MAETDEVKVAARRELMNHVQQTLLASGTAVSVVKLCHGLGLPGSSACCRPRRRCVHGLDEAGGCLSRHTGDGGALKFLATQRLPPCRPGPVSASLSA